MLLKMESVKLSEKEYKVVKTLDSDNWRYFYTLDIEEHNEVVILCQNLRVENAQIEEVEQREYPILMNKFALK